MTGGGTGHMAIVCLNLMSRTGTADYIVTGTWSEIAFEEATRFGKPRMVFKKPEKYTDIPDQSEWKLNPGASFLFYCDNDTADGVEFDFVPESNEVPIVCDMSSNFMSRPVDVSKFGVIFAGVQKNAGIAGITVAIVREDLMGHAMRGTPSIWDYAITYKNNSTLNTIPSFVIYVMERVLTWIERQGGVLAMEQSSKTKSRIIYNIIDESNGFYSNDVKKRFRSRMNLPFLILRGDKKFEDEFILEAGQRGLMNLRSFFGGFRASLYNAMTLEETQKLAVFMKEFYEQNKCRLSKCE